MTGSSPHHQPLSARKQAACLWHSTVSEDQGRQILNHLLSPSYLPLPLQPGFLLDVLQGGVNSFLQGFLVLQLLLLQRRINVDLLSDSLLGQLPIQLVNATVCVGNQGIQVIR